MKFLLSLCLELIVQMKSLQQSVEVERLFIWWFFIKTLHFKFAS